MPLTVQVPTVGIANATEAVKVTNTLTNLNTWANGNIAPTDVAATLAQSAAVNQSGQTVKGAVTNAGPGTRTNAAYGFLSDANDQVGPLTLASNGLIVVGYKAVAQCSVASVSNVALFLDANQIVVAPFAVAGAPVVAEANGPSHPNIAQSLQTTTGLGLQWQDAAGAYTGDATTGQLLGVAANSGPGLAVIFAAAGSHTVSVRFKSSSGTITASNRTLWALALSFA